MEIARREAIRIRKKATGIKIITMRDLLSHMILGITGKECEISEENSDGFIVYKVKVPSDAVGIVIGRSGKTINAIKNVLKINAIREGVRVDVQIEEA